MNLLSTSTHLQVRYTLRLIIMNNMAEMYRVTMKYEKAWRAREHALEAVMEDPDQAYGRRLLFMSELKEKNHGSITA